MHLRPDTAAPLVFWGSDDKVVIPRRDPAWTPDSSVCSSVRVTSSKCMIRGLHGSQAVLQGKDR
eukprot:NODE_15394_length_326_cov_1.801444_g14229_i0.p2 GENE.NODE_15394_length_326_cov_1.801444_g14229_i0~~NODE_15394_length_326_cov_1.801444_g14229_i0.p2  ORF type:complete len:64 (+),score=4.48 NODE_15394_length_326_cov_1.801444_g14229_i0:116-307(+)